MPSFVSDGYCLNYLVHGSGHPVVLLHGICVSFEGNYAAWGWIEQLAGKGFQVIGRGPRLAQAMPYGRYVEIAGADHFMLGRDATVQATVADFLADSL